MVHGHDDPQAPDGGPTTLVEYIGASLFWLAAFILFLFW
jgi:hypothetical protein